MIGSRTRSREIALQVLYSCDTVRAPTPELWASTLDDAESTPEVKAFAHELVAGTLGQRGAIDARSRPPPTTGSARAWRR
jgi:transcription termination factor NusB